MRTVKPFSATELHEKTLHDAGITPAVVNRQIRYTFDKAMKDLKRVIGNLERTVRFLDLTSRERKGKAS